MGATILPSLASLVAAYPPELASAVLRQALIGVAPRLYQGVVTSRCILPSINLGPEQPDALWQRGHPLMEDVDYLDVTFSNFRIFGDSGGEEVSGPLTIRLAFLMVEGTYQYHPLLFGGSPTITSTAKLVDADRLVVRGKRGQKVFLFAAFYNPGGICVTNFGGSGPGSFVDDRLFIGRVNENDSPPLSAYLTGGAGIPDQHPGFQIGAAAIVSSTTRSSVFGSEDSRGVGWADGFDAEGHLGEIMHAVGPNYAYVSASAGSYRLDQFLASHDAQKTIADKCDTIVNGLSGNDLFDTPGVVVNDRRLRFNALFPGKKIIELTVPPGTPAAETTIFNDLVRARCRPWDIADAASTSRNSQTWKDGYSGDGVHELPAGTAAEMSAIDLTRLVR